MFISDSAVTTSVVVKTVVTVNLVTENFPLDTLITKWARAVPVASYVLFLSRIFTRPALTWLSGTAWLKFHSKALLLGFALPGAHILGIAVIRV